MELTKEQKYAASRYALYLFDELCEEYSTFIMNFVFHSLNSRRPMGARDAALVVKDAAKKEKMLLMRGRRSETAFHGITYEEKAVRDKIVDNAFPYDKLQHMRFGYGEINSIKGKLSEEIEEFGLRCFNDGYALGKIEEK